MASRKHITPTQLDLTFGPREEWKPVPGYEGRYEVSNMGQVRSLDRIEKCGKKLRPTHGCILRQDNSFGYKRVHLRADGKPWRVMVHVLVLYAFVGPRPEGYEANHLDGNKSNNVLDNLEWVTRRENSLHAYATGLSGRDENHPNAKLTVKQVQEIRILYAQGGTLHGLSRSFGVSVTNIRTIVDRISWRHIP